ncbi:MAG: hypothetical protein PHC61_17945 [Chitinivibrionales bacterium]|nr:hypothetical protein [Chitinivibrionales bacterium]
MPKMFFAGILIALCALPRFSSAQVIVEENIKTDSIDVFAGAQKAAPSIALPLLATVVLPGAGHEMLHKQNRAIAYISADALLVFGLIFCESLSQAKYNNAKTYAYTFAGAIGGPGADQSYWSNVSQYMDSNGLDALSAGYNQTQELNRAFDKKYIADNLQWRWQTDDNRKEFGTMLTSSTELHVAATFCLSALIVNRVIALIDLRVSSRQGAVTGHAAGPAFQLQPSFNFQRNLPGLALAANF